MKCFACEKDSIIHMSTCDMSDYITDNREGIVNFYKCENKQCLAKYDVFISDKKEMVI